MQIADFRVRNQGGPSLQCITSLQTFPQIGNSHPAIYQVAQYFCQAGSMFMISRSRTVATRYIE